MVAWVIFDRNVQNIRSDRIFCTVHFLCVGCRTRVIFRQMPLQFGTAEYKETPGTDICRSCGQPVGAQYYRSGTAMICTSCAEKIQREGPTDSQAAFTRALLCGIGGALLGLALYATFAIVTGLIIGYVSLAVGFIVAKAMMLGSKGIGGRRYQIAAVILTYAAVSLAAIPISIAYMVKNRGAAPQTQMVKKTQSESSSNTDQPQQQPTASEIGFGEAVFRLVLLGLASPFWNCRPLELAASLV
jgi:hypothetical protein